MSNKRVKLVVSEIAFIWILLWIWISLRWNRRVRSNEWIINETTTTVKQIVEHTTHLLKKLKSPRNYKNRIHFLVLVRIVSTAVNQNKKKARYIDYSEWKKFQTDIKPQKIIIIRRSKMKNWWKIDNTVEWW